MPFIAIVINDFDFLFYFEKSIHTAAEVSLATIQ